MVVILVTIFFLLNNETNTHKVERKLQFFNEDNVLLLLILRWVVNSIF